MQHRGRRALHRLTESLRWTELDRAWQILIRLPHHRHRRGRRHLEVRKNKERGLGFLLRGRGGTFRLSARRNLASQYAPAHQAERNQERNNSTNGGQREVLANARIHLNSLNAKSVGASVSPMIQSMAPVPTRRSGTGLGPNVFNLGTWVFVQLVQFAFGPDKPRRAPGPHLPRCPAV